ncbi:MAG: hypothetical protein SD837_15510 [Candidatus Electrothrix scaldis]|nr:MAG: hypothetical protein SD837_15510 [Candidatus Electrothrix sp. GW3-3]
MFVDVFRALVDSFQYLFCVFVNGLYDLCFVLIKTFAFFMPDFSVPSYLTSAAWTTEMLQLIAFFIPVEFALYVLFPVFLAVELNLRVVLPLSRALFDLF